MFRLESSFNGARLKSARQYNKMTIGEVAEAIGLTNQAISQFENNKAVPKTENIFSLSNLLNFPREYFFEEDILNKSTNYTYFRSLSSTSKKNQNAQIEKVKLLAKIFEAIEQYINFPEFKLEYSGSINPEEMAEYVRQHWKLGNGPIYNIIDIMEQNGIIISSTFEKSSDIDAYSRVEVINKRTVPIVILGHERTAFRQQFNAAHELGHVITDGFFDIDEFSKLEYKNMEQLMNEFAGALLIPKDMYLKDLSSKGKTDFMFYVELKKKYRVSAAALIVRAHQLGAITVNQYQYLMKQRGQKDFIKEEPYDKDTPVTRPRYLKHAMKLIIENKKISGDTFMETLSSLNLTLHKEMVEQLLGLELGYLGRYDKAGDIILSYNIT
jgi:Zn-dependent peptidase ImmA (M78 family)/DNA-binding XRE family transcriptional regulator